MANHPWYPFFPGDYARDTSHLTLAEHGAYRLLLDHYYSTGRLIPADQERVFCICRAFTSELQASVRSVLKQFFTETPDGWRNQRADRQIEKQQRVSAKYAARAKNAAAARWEHDASSMPQAMLRASEPEPEPEPENPPPITEDFVVDSVLEENPARGDVDVPNDLHPVNYAAGILDEVRLPHTQDNLRTIAAAVEAEIKGGKNPPSAYEVILAGVREAQVCGWVIDRFFFSDAKYRIENRRSRNGDSSKPSASAARSARSKQNILDGFAANARRSSSLN